LYLFPALTGPSTLPGLGSTNVANLLQAALAATAPMERNGVQLRECWNGQAEQRPAPVVRPKARVPPQTCRETGARGRSGSLPARTTAEDVAATSLSRCEPSIGRSRRARLSGAKTRASLQQNQGAQRRPVRQFLSVEKEPLSLNPVRAQMDGVADPKTTIAQQ
jgi:hypothetical protein